VCAAIALNNKTSGKLAAKSVIIRRRGSGIWIDLIIRPLLLPWFTDPVSDVPQDYQVNGSGVKAKIRRVK
jgi:hypothetical protein